MSDLLELRYIPISQAELFDNNAKLHNLDQIIASIAKYGFKSACKWEGTLNNGRGGVVAGNGRVEALQIMEERGDDCPIGIALSDTGEWCVPVLFGVESSSEVVARAYALDDNNLTLLGGDFAVADLMKLYNQELLLSELEELSKYNEIPVSIGEVDLEHLLGELESESLSSSSELIQEQRGKDVGEQKDSYNSSSVRQIVLVFSIEEYNAFIDKIDEIKTKIDINNNTECLQWLVENYEV